MQRNLASAQGELRRLLSAQKGAAERGRRGRALVLGSAQSGDLRDRLAGMEETRTAGKLETALSVRIAATSRRIEQAQRSYMAKRMERRQVEVLIEAAESEERLLTSRRAQQALDDGHRSRTTRSRF
jgi:flagellar biosynthesis chaperone FliJ